MPDRFTGQLNPLGHGLHDRLGPGHGQECACPPRHTLFGSTVVHQTLKFSFVGSG
jgi:hypothetical protein